MCRVLERWGSLPEALGLLWPQPLLAAPPCQCLLHFLAAETNVNTANSFTFYILSAKDDLFQSLTFIWIVLQDLYFSKKKNSHSKKNGHLYFCWGWVKHWPPSSQYRAWGVTFCSSWLPGCPHLFVPDLALDCTEAS